MEPVLEVDPDTVRALATNLRSCADSVEALVLPAPIAMPNSVVAVASAQARDAIVDAYRDMAARIRRMASAAAANAADYDATEQVFRDELQRYQAGLG
jgi:hypothetical protein